MKSNKQLLFQTLNFQYLAIVICLIFQSNFTKAQSLQNSLEQATRDLVNPIYAIIEVPQTDGTIKYIEVKKNELDKISQLEDNYNWVKNVELAIDESIFHKKVGNKNSEYIEVTLAENCNFNTSVVMVKAEMKKIVEIPVGCYGGVNTKRVKVTKLITVPARYDTVSDTILIKPASTKIISSPSKYETVTEIIEVAPATTKWIKRRSKRCCFGSLEDCQVWVMVEVPARYESITLTTLKHKPLCPRKIVIPAKYEVVTKTILVKPETTKEVIEYFTKTIIEEYPIETKTIKVPAEYKTVIQKSLKDSSKIIKINVPSDYSNKNDKQDIRIQTTDIIRHYQPKSDNILIFPNPASDKVTVQSKDNIEQIQVFDAQGRVVFSHFYKNKNTVLLEINDFNNGFYSIQVKTSVTLQTSKILKQ